MSSNNHSNESDTESPDQTTIQVDGQPLVVTREDAVTIQKALKEYMTSSRQQIEQAVPANWLLLLPEPTAAKIDWLGSVRIGAWLLEARAGQLMLTHRLPSEGKAFGCQFVALLDRADGQWTVLSISFEHLRFRR